MPTDPSHLAAAEKLLPCDCPDAGGPTTFGHLWIGHLAGSACRYRPAVAEALAAKDAAAADVLKLTDEERIVVADYEKARELGELEAPVRAAWNLYKIIRRQRTALDALRAREST